jgi:hypothetical protein
MVYVSGRSRFSDMTLWEGGKNVVLILVSMHWKNLYGKSTELENPYR